MSSSWKENIVKHRVLKKIIIGYSVILFSHCLRADDIKLAGDPWCPFTCSPDSDRPGLIVEIAKELLESQWHKVTYVEIAWARALQDTRENQINGVAGALKADGPDFVFPKSSWAIQRSCFFVKKGSAWKYKGLASLNGQKIGAVKDYTYGEPFDSFAQKSKDLDLVSGTGTTLKLFKKLIDDRDTVIIEDETVAKYILANEKDLSAAKVEKAVCLAATPLYVAFSPKNPKSQVYANEFDDAFKKFKSSAKMKEILKHYGL